MCLCRILEVARCSQLTDVGFTSLARVSKQSHKHTAQLKPVYADPPELLTTQIQRVVSSYFLSLFHFLQNCHELEKMDLEECVQVSHNGLALRE